MIVYRGQLWDNGYQQELIKKLHKEVCLPIICGERLMAQTVIDACDVLARRVLSGMYDDVVGPFMKAFDISQAQFQSMVGLFTKEGLEYKCAIELCDKDGVIDKKIYRERYPLGVLLHIAAGNVDVLPAYSVVEGLLSGNVNILKLPMGDSGLSVRLLHELTQIELRLCEYIYVFDVPSTETATLKELADMSDGIVVWGGDEAVTAARRLAAVNTKIIAWGHKLSFAYAETDATDQQLEQLAKGICATNQLLCSSCQGIFVDTDSDDVQTAFAERFFEVLRRVNAQATPVDYGMKAKNAIHLYNERLERHHTGNTVLSADGVSVLICEDDRLDLSYMYRNVWVKRLLSKEIGQLRRYKGYLQTAAVLTTDAVKREQIAKRLACAGVVRITSAGQMSRMISGEAHDGMYALREYSRIVETECFERFE